MAGVRDHSQLDAWRLSDELRRAVAAVATTVRFERHWALRDQLLSASSSPCANIAEGFSRFHPRDFARFLRIAKGSMSEVMEHVRVAVEGKLVSEEEAVRINALAKRARGATTRLILYREQAKTPGQR